MVMSNVTLGYMDELATPSIFSTQSICAITNEDDDYQEYSS